MSFSEAAEAFLLTRTVAIPSGHFRFVSKASLGDYRKQIRALGVYFDDRKLYEIDLGAFNEYQQIRAEGTQHFRRLGKTLMHSPAGPNKINKELALLLRIMKMTLASMPRPTPWDDARLFVPDLMMAAFARNLAEIESFYLRYLVVDADIPRALSVEQQELFLKVAASRAEWHPVWWYSLIALDLTFSSDEMRTIRQGDINLTYQIVGVNRRFGKNKFRRREIPIASGACIWAFERLFERARELVGELQPHHFLLPGRIVRNVFSGEEHMSETGLRKPFEAIRAEAGLEWFQINGWRHTAITRLAEAGVPIAIMQERAGHMSPKMTAHYTHISEQAQRLAVTNAMQRKPVLSAHAAELRKQVVGY